MALEIHYEVFQGINALLENAYPEEGVGLLLGASDGEVKRITAFFRVSNAREQDARHNRYLINPEDYLRGEDEAARLGLDVVGVFHSHPDHPDQPSEFDRDWALPGFSYLITSVESGKVTSSRAWQLASDRSTFIEDDILINPLPVVDR